MRIFSYLEIINKSSTYGTVKGCVFFESALLKLLLNFDKIKGTNVDKPK